ncbi:MAG: hypothetical protein ACXU85_01795 [Xanthobacteraceae bacterium]
MNAQFPRKITITRVQDTFTPADGLHQGEVLVLANLDATIQLKRDAGMRSPYTIPAASNADASMPVWAIFLPPGAAGPDAIRKGDKVTALDTGETFEVTASNWQPLGYHLSGRNYIP